MVATMTYLNYTKQSSVQKLSSCLTQSSQQPEDEDKCVRDPLKKPFVPELLQVLLSDIIMHHERVCSVTDQPCSRKKSRAVCQRLSSSTSALTAGFYVEVGCHKQDSFRGSYFYPADGTDNGECMFSLRGLLAGFNSLNSAEFPAGNRRALTCPAVWGGGGWGGGQQMHNE